MTQDLFSQPFGIRPIRSDTSKKVSDLSVSNTQKKKKKKKSTDFSEFQMISRKNAKTDGIVANAIDLSVKQFSEVHVLRSIFAE